VGIRFGTGVLAALVAGTALGAVAHALMALLPLAAGGSSSFSWSGTAFILALYVLVMVPAVGVAGEEVGASPGFDALQWLGVAAAGAAVFAATIGLLPLLTVGLTDRWPGRRRCSILLDADGRATPSEVTSPATAAH
jgi:hypothetical protein